MKTTQFDVTGMSCAACVNHIEKRVQLLPGIKSVEVHLLTNGMTVAYDEAAVTPSSIETAVKKAGYGAAEKNAVKEGKTNRQPNAGLNDETLHLKRRFWGSVLFWLPLFWLNMAPMLGWSPSTGLSVNQHPISVALLNLLLTLPVIYLNRHFFSGGFRSLFQASPTMDTLVAIGTSASFIYGTYALFKMGYAFETMNMSDAHQYAHALYFESAATILTLVTLGKYLEARSKGKTTAAITRLMDLAPKTALVLQQGREVEIPLELVRSGDEVVVKPGQQIPVDGVVINGQSFVNQAAITGESLPVFKQSGDTVLSGTINQTGYFTFKAVHVGEDTTLTRIIRLMETVAASKAPIARLADQISLWFVPFVLLIAVATSITWLLLGYSLDFALTTGIAVLVISCPCALGLATPVALVVGTGKGAEKGILFKSAAALELAHRVNTLLLDKTGTVTTGKPTVTDVVRANGATETAILQLAASLEKHAEHPLGKAVMDKAGALGLELFPIDAFNAETGKGVTGRFQGFQGWIGNKKYVQEAGIEVPESFQEKLNVLMEQGKSPLFVAHNASLLGVIFVADQLKPGAKEALQRLKARGLHLVMLTGDQATTAQAIALEAGISDVRSDLMPQDKERIVSEWQASGKVVAMVGDGINDAPALARSHVGIAMRTGTDIAMDSADVVLMLSDLNAINDLFELSDRVVSTIKQNLFWAFFYNLLGIPLAAGVFYWSTGWLLSPMIAAAAMSLSSVTVVLNALRLKRALPNQTHQTNQTQMKTTTLYVEGMSCSHCVASVEKALNALEGVKASVELSTNKATVNHTDNVTEDDMKKAIIEAGYSIRE